MPLPQDAPRDADRSRFLPRHRDELFAYLAANAARFRAELFDYLRIPSISSQSAHAADLRRAAEWTRNRCRAAGLTADLAETDGWPVVLGNSEPKPGRPTILIYGHYDVQPEGDLSLWHTGPFEPVVRDGRIIARGAADNKGQLLCAILALESWMKTAGELPINVKVLIEGEEEVGSPNLGIFVERNRERLACDYIVIHDTAMYDEGIPAVTVATRGLVYKEVIVRGPKKDLHSGGYGGAVANPANELARLIASLHDAEGRVNIPGFYDHVRELTAAERADLNTLPFSEAAFLEEVGCPRPQGEKGYTTLERQWVRPTLDVNGLYGGYTKEGASTIIPSFAGAKISMRLVPDQKTLEIGRLFEETVRARLPDTVRVEIKDHSGCDPYVANLHSPGLAAVRRAAAEAYGREPVLSRTGGSLPILPMFKRHLGADSLMLGYCLPTCNAHSPNEFFHIRDFEAGMRASAALYGLLAETA